MGLLLIALRFNQRAARVVPCGFTQTGERDGPPAVGYSSRRHARGEDGMHDQIEANLDNTGSAREVFLVFLKLGLTSFGGPIAHLGYFREEFVARRGWIGE